jgi:Zn-dependent peptidase ImmA (M78 family)/transcriptional regulator with XRE-family HTH domain
MTGIGEVLETARRARGLSQHDLADAVGITQAALSRYEHDLRAPDQDVLGRLAEALGVTPDLLTHGERMEGGIAVGSHMRRRATARPTVWRELEARLNMLRLHASRLMEEVSIRADRHVPTFDPIDTTPDAAAHMLRTQWRMPSGPVHSLATWLDAAGVLVVEDDFGPAARVDGLSQWVGAYPVILVNGSAPTDRKRLTLAHELGHLVLHTEFVDEDAESQANAFAAELLMPAAEIKPILRGRLTLDTLLDLKRYWGTSMQSLIERAYTLGTVNAQERTNLYKRLSARGMRTHEPGSNQLTPEAPRLARHIAESLHARGLDADEIAHLAGFSSPRENAVFAVNEPRPLHAV